MGRDRGILPEELTALDCILIATYNERPNITALLPILFERMPQATIVIVDDNSPDGTARVPEELGAGDRVRVIVRTKSRGYGTAMRDGMRACLRMGARRVVTMDADFSHDPAELPAMFAALERADMVLGSRYCGGVRVLNWQISRLLLSLFANAYVRTILGFRVADCTSGFRGYRRSLLARMPLKAINSNGYSFLVELLVHARRAGARFAEHPIVYTERREGQSKMSKAVILESVFMPWRLRMRELFGARR